MRQQWYTGYGFNTRGTGTVHINPCGFAQSTISSNDVMAVAIPCAATIENLVVNLSVAPGGVTSRTFTLFVNGISTALAVTVTGAAVSGQDTAHQIAVNAGDTIEFRQTTSGAVATSRLAVTYETLTATATDAIMWGICENFNIGGGASRFVTACGGRMANGDTNEDTEVFPAAVAGTVTALYVHNNNASGSDGTRGYDLQFRLNKANAGAVLSLRGTGQNANATGLSLTFAIGDLWSWEYTNVVGANTSTHIGLAVCYTPTAGVAMVAGVDITGPAAASTQYGLLIQGYQSFDIVGAGDPACQVFVGVTGLTLTGLRVRLASATGAGVSAIYTLYQASVGVLNQTATVTAGQQTGADSGHSDVLTPGEALELQYRPGGGGGAGQPFGWCFGVAVGSRQRTLVGVGT